MPSHRTERCDFDWFRPAGEIQMIVLMKMKKEVFIKFIGVE